MEDQLKDFMHYLMVEKGLAKNTIVSYERDLKSYLHYLKNLNQFITLNDVQRCTYCSLFRNSKRTREISKTLARHIASIRAFINFY